MKFEGVFINFRALFKKKKKKTLSQIYSYLVAIKKD